MYSVCVPFRYSQFFCRATHVMHSAAYVVRYTQSHSCTLSKRRQSTPGFGTGTSFWRTWSSRSVFAVAGPSVCRLSSVCLSSVRLMRPTQAVEILAIFLRHLVPWPSVDIHIKFYRDRPRGTPPPRQLNTRVVVKYSDFGPIKGYISETVQDRR